MGVERNALDTIKIKKSNSEDLYRNESNGVIRRSPEDARESIVDGTSLNIEVKDATSLSYSNPAIISTTTTSKSCNNSPIHRNENVVNNATTSTQPTTVYKWEHQMDEEQKQPQRQQTRRERRPDRAVYIPRARRSQTTPPNTVTTQIQPPTQSQQSTQLPLRTPVKTSDTNKSLDQQQAITLVDTKTALVKQKSLAKADDEADKVGGGVVFNSNCSNNSTTTTTLKKKEKINKESRDLRREQRLLRKLSIISTHHIQNQKNNEEFNESSIKNILKNQNGDEITNQEFITNAQQMQSSTLISCIGNFSKISDNIFNLSKGFNCDSSEEFMLNRKEEPSCNTTIIRESESIQKNQINVIESMNASSSNTSESQFLCKPVQSIEINCKTATENILIFNNVAAESSFINNSNINTMPNPSLKTKSNKPKSDNQTKLSNLRIEDVASQRLPSKCDVEEQELQRASKEINRSNRRIIKQTFISDVLQIPDNVDEEENYDKLTDDKLPTKSLPTATQVDSNTEDEEEDDWENMYNDSGDCLDPKIMQELTASVGKCKIELPKMDYSAFLTKQSILNEEEFPHVLEVSNFPVEFRTHDLLMIFSQYKESGFDIKWVDDTHALAVFSSSAIAAEVLTMGHPFVILKPLTEATIESRLKAKKCAASLQPYRPRPETCAALARRLVTGALGVRLKTAAAERENEKRVLREAKERKLLAAKQRDEVWES